MATIGVVTISGCHKSATLIVPAPEKLCLYVHVKIERKSLRMMRPTNIRLCYESKRVASITVSQANELFIVQ